jgi:hypothetical protein
VTSGGEWAHLRAFCLFLGYGRSGHSLIGSLIDAHPQAVVAHEYHAVRACFEGTPRDVLLTEIFEQAQAQARDGRVGSRADGGVYRYDIAGQCKHDRRLIEIIGSKKGAGSAWQFAQRGIDRLTEFKAYIDLPVKILHVVRNPFDMIAGARLARGESRVTALIRIVDAIRSRHRDDHWLDMHFEDLLAAPQTQIPALLRFLELPVDAAHLQHCRQHLFATPRARRHDVIWTHEERRAVEAVIERHDFLHRYSWDS